MAELLTPESTLPSTFATRSAVYMARHGCTPEQICDTLINECEVSADEARRIVNQVIPGPRPDEQDRPVLVAA